MAQDTNPILTLLLTGIKSGLTSPHLTIPLNNGTKAKFRLSKKSLNIVNVYNGDRTWLGYYDAAGFFNPRFCSLEHAAELAALQREADLIASLAVRGRKSGICCFCARQLDNKSSVFHGYGPICADNYGLPWGDTGEPSPAPIKEVSPEDI